MTEKKPCSVCGSTEHTSWFRCPEVSETDKMAARLRGAAKKKLRDGGRRLVTREGRRAILCEALAEATTVAERLAVLKEYRIQFKEQEDEALSNTIARATAIIKEQKAREQQA